MTKYNTLFKQQFIEFYLQNGKNRSLTRWINQFNHSGIAAKSNFLEADHIRAILYRQKSR